MNQKELEVRQAVYKRLREAEAVYVIMSGCTKEAYVHCDPETFDDEILMYTRMEAAQAEAKRMAEEKIPVGVAKVDKEHMLLFCTGLYTMGINALLARTEEHELRIQLTEFVTRKDPKELEEGGKVWVENPELHLTMLYYMQDFRRNPTPQPTKELRELQEEIGAHFAKGRYIVAVSKEETEKGIPLVKLNNGDVFQPIFTDVMQFQRFNREQKFRAVIVEAGKLASILPQEAKGIILNPLGVNMPLSVMRPEAAAPQA